MPVCCKDLQIIRSTSNYAPCKICDTDLTQLGNFKYKGIFIDTPTYRQEDNVCSHCGAPFIIHYDFFDFMGHICNYVVSQDLNDPEHKWQDNYTKEQVEKISSHLENCDACKNALQKQIADDLVFLNKETLKGAIAFLQKRQQKMSYYLAG